MANATDIVKKGTVRRQDEFITRKLSAAAAERTFYPNSMLGLNSSGYSDKFDDTQSLQFDGLFRGLEGKFKQPVSSAGDYNIDTHQPFRFELAISGVTIADIEKKVYALDDQTGTLSASATTYANLVGVIKDVQTTGIAVVEPAYDGKASNLALGAARVMAATGAQTLTEFDLNKTIFVPNTAGLTLTLPAVASTQAGDRLTIVKTTADAAAVTLDPADSETIDNGATLATIDARYDCATLVSTGSEWVVLSRDIA
jgi:hypothetical protein